MIEPGQIVVDRRMGQRPRRGGDGPRAGRLPRSDGRYEHRFVRGLRHPPRSVLAGGEKVPPASPARTGERREPPARREHAFLARNRSRGDPIEDSGRAVAHLPTRDVPSLVECRLTRARADRDGSRDHDPAVLPSAGAVGRAVVAPPRDAPAPHLRHLAVCPAPRPVASLGLGACGSLLPGVTYAPCGLLLRSLQMARSLLFLY